MGSIILVALVKLMSIGLEVGRVGLGHTPTQARSEKIFQSLDWV